MVLSISIIVLISFVALVLFSRLNKYWTVLYLLLATAYSLFIITYLVADYLTGNGIDEAAKFHIFAGVEGHGFAQFADLVLIGSGLFLLSFAMVVFLIFKLRKKIAHFSYKANIFAVLGISLAMFYHPASAIFITHTPIAELAGMKFKDFYRQPQIIQAADSTNQKNIIYIYAESVERTYLNEKVFPGLMPNLKKLEQEATSFTNVQQVINTGWTIAGMTATQCGIHFVSANELNLNKPFRESNTQTGFFSKATCMGDILSDQGYRLEYLGGASLDFVNKGEFYKSHSFDSIKGLEELKPLLADPNHVSRWGVYDDELFNIAKSEMARLSKQEKPFGFFMLTLDTHSPNGHVSNFCKDVKYQDGSNPILNSVHCTDIQIANFVNYLRQQDYAKDTVIVISSDHLAMRNSAWDQLNSVDRKNLVMILDPSKSEPRLIDTPMSMLDVGPSVFSALGLYVSFGLGRDVNQEKTLSQEFKNTINPILAGWREDVVKFWSEDAKADFNYRN